MIENQFSVLCQPVVRRDIAIVIELKQRISLTRFFISRYNSRCSLVAGVVSYPHLRAEYVELMNVYSIMNKKEYTLKAD